MRFKSGYSALHTLVNAINLLEDFSAAASSHVIVAIPRLQIVAAGAYTGVAARNNEIAPRRTHAIVL